MAVVVAGQSPPSSEVSELRDGGQPFLQGNAEFGIHHPTAIHQCESTPKRARRGDILISVRAPVGALNVADHAYGIGRGLAAVRPHRETDARYLWWALHAAVDRLHAVATGSTYPAVRAQDVGSLAIATHPAERQRAIAGYLDRETARIDALIEKKERLIALLDEKEIALLSEELTQRSPRIGRLRFLAVLQTGITMDSGREISSDAVTLPYLRVANVQSGWLDLDNIAEVTVPLELAVRATLRQGDVLMTEGGDLDKLGRGTLWEGQIPHCLHQNHVFAVRPDPRFLDAGYLALLTRTSQARRYFESTGVKVTNLASTNSDKILNLPVPLLPVDRQRRVVAVCTARVAKINGMKRIITRQIALIHAKRQALITAAVNGLIPIPGAA